ncbi:MAG: Glu/Leu/Phe/Val dehydrogenase family protein, partial [Pseudomonadota bacterium]
KSDAMFRAMGRHVENLGGNYTVAEDVGITVEDVEIMGQSTRHVAGTSGAGSSGTGVGDPSPATAYGVYMGIKKAVLHKLKRNSLSGIRVSVQGLGAVGYHLCRRLAAEGAELIVTDLNGQAVERAVQELGARAVELDHIYDQAVDVFAPCALGAVINDETLPRLEASIVAGSANNQLAESWHGIALSKMDKLYVPDFVVNAGGLILVAQEHAGGPYDEAKTYAHIARIGDTLMEIFAIAESQNVATSEAADRLAEARFQKGDQSAAA